MIPINKSARDMLLVKNVLDCLWAVSHCKTYDFNKHIGASGSQLFAIVCFPSAFISFRLSPSCNIIRDVLTQVRTWKRLSGAGVALPAQGAMGNAPLQMFRRHFVGHSSNIQK